MISAVSAPIAQSFQPRPNFSAGQKDVSLEDRGIADTAASEKSQPKEAPAVKAPSAILELTEEEKAQVADLKKIDQEVRAHEQAHKNAGGQYAGSASFGYQVGPDGRRYAVSGEVPIDIAPVEGDPAATIAKLNAVISAALAPAKPSDQDRRVASQAVALRASAQAELAKATQDELAGVTEDDDGQGAINISALAAYDAGASTGNSSKPSGNFLDFIS